MTHHILIVEDDRHFATQLRELFDYHGLETSVATTGAEGIEAFQDRGADFVLIDVMLPGVHGLRVLAQIRSLPSGADVPAILMSAVYQKESMFAADLKRLGAHGFLAKPFSVIDLGRKVNAILAEPEGGRASVRMLLAPSAPAADPLPSASAQTDGRASPLQSAARTTDRSLTHQVGAAPELTFSGGGSPANDPAGEETLDRAGYARLVTHLFHSHASGVLRLSHGTDRLTLFFLNGYPVWAETPRPADLVDWLVNEGVLVADQVQHLLTCESAPEIREELLRTEVIGIGALAPLLEGWLAWQVRRTLEAEVGSFVFETTDEFAGMIPVYEVNPIREVWQALRDVRVDVLEPDFAGLSGRALGRTRSFNRLFGYIGTSDELRSLGEYLLDPRPLEDVRRRFSDDDSTRCLWLLISAGLVAIADAPVSSQAREKGARRGAVRGGPPAGRPRPQTARADKGKSPPMPPVSRGSGPGDKDTRRYGKGVVDALRNKSLAVGPPSETSGEANSPEARVARDYVTRMELDHYAFLNVPREASTATIDEAYQSLAPHYRLRNLGGETHPDTRRQAKELLSKLVEAFEELSNPVTRRRYNRDLAEGKARRKKVPRPGSTPGSSIPGSANDPLSGYPSSGSVERLSELGPTLGDELLKRWLQARRAIHSGDHQRALSLFETLRTDLPSEPGLLADMAWCRLNLGSPSDARTQDKALEWVQLAAAFRPGHPDVVEVNARILTYSSTPKLAVRALERLAALRPDLIWVSREIARHRALIEAAGDGNGMFSGLFGRGRNRGQS